MKTLSQMASLFGNLAAGGYKNHLSPTLDLIGNGVKIEVQKEIGEYNPAIANYPVTASLADSTIERKSRDGLGNNGPDSPLWAEGDYHNSIQTAKNVSKLCVEIGSNVKYVKFHELGTADMPPRRIFGPSTLRAIPPLLPAIAKAAGMGITGGVWKGLGAEGITHTPAGPSANVMP